MQLRREENICTIKAKITAEHKLQAVYKVVATVVEAADENIEEQISSCECLSCIASEGIFYFINKFGKCTFNLLFLLHLLQVVVSMD